MLKSRICPICKSKAHAQPKDYRSGKFHRNGKEEIVVEDVEFFECSENECGHRWLPLDQERKIDRTVAQLSRYDLSADEIRLIRESFPFGNKSQTADFLCLNEKAFTKWELGYSEPNRAYDLLLRLAAHSRENFSFIQHLHKTNFTFNPSDYEMVCDRHNIEWSFNVIKRAQFQFLKKEIVISSSQIFSPSVAVTGPVNWFSKEGSTSYSPQNSTFSQNEEKERARAS